MTAASRRQDRAADAGVFGPDSLTWRVHGDPVLWVAGLRALYLQALHPAARAGVLEHSDFRADPWGRLLRTAGYVGTVSYGSTAEVQAAAAHVRRLHARVRGADARTGVTYRAEDPELLRWVHCCEVESFLSTFQRAGGGLTPTQVDAYYAEQTAAAALLGVDPATVPANAAQVAAYFAALRPQLAADDRARRIAWYVLVPPMPRWVALATPARASWAAVAGLAFALLPRWARRCYGLPGLALTDVTASAQLRLLAELAHRLPAGVREGPHQRRARERVG